jgi:hypothetical protein
MTFPTSLILFDKPFTGISLHPLINNLHDSLPVMRYHFLVLGAPDHTERVVLNTRIAASLPHKLQEALNLVVGHSMGICGIRNPKDICRATKFFLILHISSQKETQGTLMSEKSATAIGFT